jgi:hypothetical protein
MFNYLKIFSFFILIILIAWIAGAIINMDKNTNKKSSDIKLPFKIVDHINGTVQQGSGCVPAGCSNELCVEEDIAKNISSICEYKDVYSCYKKSKCERQNNDECGWTETKELIECVGKF